LAWTGSVALPEGRDRTPVGGEKDGAALRVNCATDLEKSGFALDSLLEEAGFEPLVPPVKGVLFPARIGRPD
jgi:hypothetical protein